MHCSLFTEVWETMTSMYVRVQTGLLLTSTWTTSTRNHRKKVPEEDGHEQENHGSMLLPVHSVCIILFWYVSSIIFSWCKFHNMDEIIELTWINYISTAILDLSTWQATCLQKHCLTQPLNVLSVPGKDGKATTLENLSQVPKSLR